jgi:hypothetical protein
MHFREDEVTTFKSIFEASKQKIRDFPGVLHLELLQDKKKPCVFFTYSEWQSEEALEEYRNSMLFKTTWAKTKPLFSEPAQAWSSERLAYLP